jgi:hypothetical protein
MGAEFINREAREGSKDLRIFFASFAVLAVKIFWNLAE